MVASVYDGDTLTLTNSLGLERAAEDGAEAYEAEEAGEPEGRVSVFLPIGPGVIP